MSEYNNNYYSQNNGLTFSQYLSKVFSIVGVGVGITAVVSFVISRFMETILARFAGVFTGVVLGAIVLELVLAIYFAARLKKMSKGAAWFCYILYSVLTGITLSLTLYYYTDTSIYLAFGVTCLMFVVMSLIGHNANVDLSKFSGLIIPALIGLVLMSLLNIFFFRNDVIQWIINYAGIIIFLFLIAYDMQRLRDLYQQSFEDGELGEKLMIYGAFQLYLDFINLFIRLLEILGKKKD